MDKSLHENLGTHFENMNDLKRYVMNLIYKKAVHNVFSSLQQNLYGIWSSYISENKGRYDDHRLLSTPDDLGMSLRKYIHEQLNLLTETIRSDFNRYYTQVFGAFI